MQSGVKEKNYYEIMGVESTATFDEIKAAFRTLALKYHPDKNSNPEAEEQFKKINNIYEILSDSVKRKAYDQSLIRIELDNIKINKEKKKETAHSFFSNTSQNYYSHNVEIMARQAEMKEKEAPKNCSFKKSLNNRNYTVSNENLSGCNFNNADLSYLTFLKVNFNKANIQSADCMNSRFQHTNFSHADLTDIEMNHAVFDDCNLTNAKLINAKLNKVTFINVDFSQADLSGANLSGSDLSQITSLVGANLTKVNFYNANLNRLNLQNVNFKDSCSLVKANLEYANLSGANLNSVALRGANLRGANLSDANLNFASLYEADLTDANLTGADLTDTFLFLTKLTNTHVLLFEDGCTLAEIKNKVDIFDQMTWPPHLSKQASQENLDFFSYEQSVLRKLARTDLLQLAAKETMKHIRSEIIKMADSFSPPSYKLSYSFNSLMNLATFGWYSTANAQEKPDSQKKSYHASGK